MYIDRFQQVCLGAQVRRVYVPAFVGEQERDGERERDIGDEEERE